MRKGGGGLAGHVSGSSSGVMMVATHMVPIWLPMATLFVDI